MQVYVHLFSSIIMMTEKKIIQKQISH